MCKYVMTISYGQTHLIAVCRVGAKCFLAYSSGILGSTIARKSRPSISDGSLVDLQGGFIHTFSDVRCVEFPREVQKILHLVAEFQQGQ